MAQHLRIGRHTVGPGHQVFLVAELSANHGQRIETALSLIEAAAGAGAHAIKLQTYTADTITIDCDNDCFVVRSAPWAGRRLYELYEEAATPWSWYATLRDAAHRVGLEIFSSPFDATAVDFLETMDVPVYKIASFELVDLPLLEKVARTGKPVIMSTGMATLAEIDEAVTTLRRAGSGPIALMKCTSAYPSTPDTMNLRTIPHLASAFQVAVGVSDHTLDLAVPVTAVAMGASLIEKHFTHSRQALGPDSAFSLEPHEFQAMAQAVRIAEQALGEVHYGVTDREEATRALRRSIFVVQDVPAGDVFTHANLRCIRPGHGLHPRYLNDVIGRRATVDLVRGTPLGWDLVGS